MAPDNHIKSGHHLLTESAEAIHLKAVSNESDDLLNDTPTSLPSPQAETAMSRFGHFSVVTPLDNTYR